MNKLYLLILSSLILSACMEKPIEQVDTNIEQVETNEDTGNPVMAFLYQYVGTFNNGAGENGVTLGLTSDGVNIQSYDVDAVKWTIDPDVPDGYGDPVFSRLSDGNWAMTAWTGRDDTRGAGYLLYHEASCPFVDDDEVIAIGPSSAKGCKKVNTINGGKTSQIFEAEDGNYVFHMIEGKIYLAQLSDSKRSTGEMESLCVLDSAVDSLSDLDYGESTLVLSEDDLLFSDTAMGRRVDGTWVLFVKGIEKDNACEGAASLCELCARSIYRSTSSDLITWSTPEKVVTQASVPEATTTVDGTVWLYWQDFTNTCEAEDLKLGGIAPISAAYEEAGSYDLSEPQTLNFPDEEFETDSKLHYATNANPVMLPDEAAVTSYQACYEL